MSPNIGGINILVYLLIIIFGSGSWVAINGLWVELPVMITSNVLPEGWKLLSYLTLIIQVANIGPLLITYRHMCSEIKLTDRMIAYFIYGTALLSCLLLVFFWNIKIYVAGDERSLPLYILQFLMALAACSTAVVFLPFMATFKPQYMTAFFIGEGMSGFFPSIAAIAQGVGKVKCANISYISETSNYSSYETVTYFDPPNFSVKVFFLLMFVVVLFSAITFKCLNDASFCIKEHVPRSLASDQDKSVCQNDSSQDKCSHIDNSDDVMQCQLPLMKDGEKTPGTPVIYTKFYDRNFVCYLTLTACISALTNAVLPSIQTFSCLPYGPEIYHLTATLFTVRKPIASVMAIFIPITSFVAIIICFAIGLVVAFAITYMASSGPISISSADVAAPVIIVTAWVVGGILLEFIKVTISTVSRKKGRKALMLMGGVQQVGSFIGAITMYIIINQTGIFKSVPFCA